MNDLISVIVPVYNSERYLRKCLDSISGQSYRNLEIILVDDGSTDGSGAICDAYAEADPRFTVIHNPNGGPSSARNAGIRAANGAFITFADSDDTVESRAYECLLQMLRKHPEAGLAICGFRIINHGEAQSSERFDDPCEADVLVGAALWEEVFGRLNNAVWNKLYQAEAAKKICFTSGLTYGEDLLFNLNYIENCQSAVITQAPLYHYNKRSGSITTSAFTKRRLNEVRVKDEAFTLVSKYAPGQLPNAYKYCFRARMNVLRAAYKEKKEAEIASEIASYVQYLKKHYPIVKDRLRWKERAEYKLMRCCFPLYRLSIQTMFGRV